MSMQLCVDLNAHTLYITLHFSPVPSPTDEDDVRERILLLQRLERVQHEVRAPVQTGEARVHREQLGRVDSD